MKGVRPVKAVIFDFNGVIVDDEPIHMRLYRRVLEDEGAPITEREYHERYLGMDDRGIFAAALRDKGRAKQASDERYIASLVDRKAALYLDAIRGGGARPVEGALDLVRTCAEKCGGRIAVVSGALRHEIELVLDLFGARRLFAAIVAQDEMTRGKPDPEGFLRGLAALAAHDGPLAPNEVAVIEDSVPGVIAAGRAGMRSLALAGSYPEEALRRAGAGRVVATLKGLGADELDWLPESESGRS